MTQDWRTKPTDRFILRWIKVNLSARVTPVVAHIPGIRPGMVTIASALIGSSAGVMFGLGYGVAAGIIAIISQVLDGVDGQLARLTNQESKDGALLDSALDRYPDGVMMIGMTIFTIRYTSLVSIWALILCGALMFIGANLISYISARAGQLGIELGKPTLLSKGTRSTIMIVCALGTALWTQLPVLGLIFLAVTTNLVLVIRLTHVFRHSGEGE